jgi:hypothetical protein
LGLVHLFQAGNLADMDGVTPGLPEHVGANQPLDDDGEPGSEDVPLQGMTQDQREHRDEVEEEDEPGGADDDLNLPDPVFEPCQFVAGYWVAVHRGKSPGAGVMLWYSVLLPVGSVICQSSRCGPGVLVV